MRAPYREPEDNGRAQPERPTRRQAPTWFVLLVTTSSLLSALSYFSYRVWTMPADAPDLRHEQCQLVVRVQGERGPASEWKRTSAIECEDVELKKK